MSADLPMAQPHSDASTTPAARSGWFGWSDWAGMVASIGCAIHCAAMPFVIAYLPALGLSFLADEAFHQWMAVGCFLIALTAFVPGLRKHGRLTPVIVGSFGLVMISTAAFGFAGDCCSACASDASSVASAEPAATSAASGITATNASVQNVTGEQNFAGEGTGQSDTTSEACTDACCPHCATAAAGSDVAATRETVADLPAHASATSLWIARIAPWLTPLGGIVLVCAHLLNRRYGCLCGCCETEVAEVATA